MDNQDLSDYLYSLRITKEGVERIIEEGFDNVEEMCELMTSTTLRKIQLGLVDRRRLQHALNLMESDEDSTEVEQRTSWPLVSSKPVPNEYVTGVKQRTKWPPVSPKHLPNEYGTGVKQRTKWPPVSPKHMQSEHGPPDKQRTVCPQVLPTYQQKRTQHFHQQSPAAPDFRGMQQKLKNLPMRSPANYKRSISNDTGAYVAMRSPANYKRSISNDTGAYIASKVNYSRPPRMCTDDPPGLRYTQLESRLLSEDPDRMLRHVEYGSAQPYSKEKTVLMIGASGSGKSTTINCIINFILGVTIEDSESFKLIQRENESSQMESQTNWITVYTIHEMAGGIVPFTLNLVDTPGFGDTRGIERDRQTIEQYKDLFSTSEPYGLPTLDAVCLVMKASTNRKTAAVKYVMDSVLNLFGKDIQQNICIVLTYCDTGKTDVVTEMSMEMGLSENPHFQWNNSWMDGRMDDPFAVVFFKTTHDSFKRFVIFIDNCQSKSLKMSQDVLDELSLLEEAIDSLQDFIKSKLGELDTLHQLSNIMKVNSNSSIEWFADVTTKEKSTTQNMNCTKCKNTCRKDRQKRGLLKRLNSSKKKCRVCTCPSNKHEFEKYEYTKSHEKRTGTMDELMEQYLEQGNEAQTPIRVQKDKNIVRIQEAFSRVHNSIEKLNDIALKPANTSVGDYVDMVITQEEAERNPGYQERIKQLQNLKAQNKLLIDVTTMYGAADDDFI